MIKNYHYLLNIRIEENLELAKQDLALYGMFWDTGSIVESIINSF